MPCDTSLTPCEIGTTLGNMVTLNSLGIDDPKTSYQPARVAVVLHSGAQKGIGYPYIVWSWGYLTHTQRETLKQGYCPNGISSVVYIKTRELANNFSSVTFQAHMHWPIEEYYVDTIVYPFQLEFRRAVPVDAPLTIGLDYGLMATYVPDFEVQRG